MNPETGSLAETARIASLTIKLQVWQHGFCAFCKYKTAEHSGQHFQKQLFIFKSLSFWMLNLKHLVIKQPYCAENLVHVLQGYKNDNKAMETQALYLQRVSQTIIKLSSHIIFIRHYIPHFKMENLSTKIKYKL